MEGGFVVGVPTLGLVGREDGCIDPVLFDVAMGGGEGGREGGREDGVCIDRSTCFCFFPILAGLILSSFPFLRPSLPPSFPPSLPGASFPYFYTFHLFSSPLSSSSLSP